MRSALRPGKVVLTAPLSLDRPGRHNGREFPNGDLIELEPGLENTESWGAGLILDLQVEPSLAMQRGWSRDYILIRRLNRFRRLLFKEARRPGAVTRAAIRAGFEHLSQLTRLYRRLFGELPRQTLRRHAA